MVIQNVPVGWVLVAEGSEVPTVHREGHVQDDGSVVWADIQYEHTDATPEWVGQQEGVYILTTLGHLFNIYVNKGGYRIFPDGTVFITKHNRPSGDMYRSFRRDKVGSLICKETGDYLFKYEEHKPCSYVEF
jgi:hypothetical protein